MLHLTVNTILWIVWFIVWRNKVIRIKHVILLRGVLLICNDRLPSLWCLHMSNDQCHVTSVMWIILRRINNALQSLNTLYLREVWLLAICWFLSHLWAHILIMITLYGVTENDHVNRTKCNKWFDKLVARQMFRVHGRVKSGVTECILEAHYIGVRLMQ